MDDAQQYGPCEVSDEATREDAEREYVPRGEGAAGGWVRIGRYDHPRRRALWVRIAEFEGPETADFDRPGVESIELCAGREGDDAYVKFTPETPGFYDLLDCMSRSVAVVQRELFFGGMCMITVGGSTQPESEG